ncbi:hypothetical protein AKJ49_01815 [candidate division MSBL1 archaeon SCGC-AAA382A03]|uniref:Uncharacterized protein n=1 Tax=candidate division MSBL1 archaeon SCGC-AAA382A03 TaxID=1698278 RepID=A0A133VE58_9EURY|nr:hypothetical protein AKJ49_01815 [candidate division MSBL1 archaeon SCGC-AAA382A03]
MRKKVDVVKMKEVIISLSGFKNRLRGDPRIGEDYIENIELPQAFASGNKFLKKMILDKSNYNPKNKLSSDWFQFSQLIESIKVDGERLKIEYDSKKSSHAPFLSRRVGI